MDTWGRVVVPPPCAAAHLSIKTIYMPFEAVSALRRAALSTLQERQKGTEGRGSRFPRLVPSTPRREAHSAPNRSKRAARMGCKHPIPHVYRVCFPSRSCDTPLVAWAALQAEAPSRGARLSTLQSIGHADSPSVERTRQPSASDGVHQKQKCPTFMLLIRVLRMEPEPRAAARAPRPTPRASPA